MRSRARRPAPAKRGHAYADPAYDLSEDWIAASAAIEAAQRRHDDPAGSGAYS